MFSMWLKVSGAIMARGNGRKDWREVQAGIRPNSGASGE